MIGQERAHMLERIRDVVRHSITWDIVETNDRKTFIDSWLSKDMFIFGSVANDGVLPPSCNLSSQLMCSK
jgi:hypothetical protein